MEEEEGDCTESDPTECPLLHLADIDYLGSVRVPTSTSNGVALDSNGGSALAYNQATDHLYIVGGGGTKVATIDTPAPVLGTTISAMNTASFQQGFQDVREGGLAGTDCVIIAGKPAAIAGLLVYNELLYVTWSCYFDTGNVQDTVYFSHSLTLATTGVSALSRIGTSTQQHYSASGQALVPTVWQTLLGSKAIGAGWGQTIVQAMSSGPNAIGYDPAEITGGSPIARVPLLNYDFAHPTLGTWENDTTPNPLYNMTSVPGGMAIIKNTRTLMYVYSTGTGTPCYGVPTATLALHGTPAPGGDDYCYDPAKAGEAKTVCSVDLGMSPPDYPYQYYYALYDLNDLVTAKNSGNHWVPIPYEHGELTTIPSALNWKHHRMGGMAYDYDSNTMWIALTDVDEIAFQVNYPLISVLSFSP